MATTHISSITWANLFNVLSWSTLTHPGSQGWWDDHGCKRCQSPLSTVKLGGGLGAKWCPTLCDSMDSSLPGSSVHGIVQARILEWVTISFSRGSSWPRGQTQVSCIAGRFFTHLATREALKLDKMFLFSTSREKFRKFKLFYQRTEKQQFFILRIII